MPERSRARFEAQVSKEPMSGCWLWEACEHRGYGIFWHDGRKWKAHRFSWALNRGPIPDGLHVLHRCDNPSCVNPTHLFLGTAKDNARDASAKGRQWQQRFPETSYFHHYPREDRPRGAAHWMKRTPWKIVQKTHCRNGHPYGDTPRTRGFRRCVLCLASRKARYKEFGFPALLAPTEPKREGE